MECNYPNSIHNYTNLSHKITSGERLRMLNLARRTLNRFRENLDLHHKYTVHLEGGLGSQIIGVIYFWNLASNTKDRKVSCDLSYFNDSRSSESLRPWALDVFGIPLNEFQKYEKKSKLSKFFLKKDYLTDQELEVDYWGVAREKYIKRFNYSPEIMIEYFRAKIKLDLQEEYTAVHVRRGDYLQVASLLVSTNQYVELLESIQPLLSNDIVFVSDSKFSESEIELLTQAVGSDRKCHYLDSPDIEPFAVHCLLRSSSVLVCANSTFSFTAGILGKNGQRVFSPLNFHSGSDSHKYNRTLRVLNSFTLWPTRS